ncbi:PilZ domain-containing protein [uncultured Roseibium sp.]|uniref:PilZ domain-containing protein n=1 Tax=uncultured Roseibium sp. TaxID=1936171 RepID=UPI00262DBABF|nr:PilZ domain-containing protein [uncultured Roseibium sp.]
MNHLAIATNAAEGMSALVVDLADMSCFEVAARELTDTGCWIVSDKVDLLKEEVGLRIDGFDKLLHGAVIAYGDNEAQISFEVNKPASDDKRREVRRPVWITAIVCGKSNPVSMKCRIVDASRSGCRLEGEHLTRLPDNIDISIPGLDLPVAGRIVWHKNGQAGVQLSWPFATEPAPQPNELIRKLQEEKAEPKPKPVRKKKISAFGA